MTELRETMRQMKLTAFTKRFERYGLVILDELGYISFDKEGSDMLFNLLSSRQNKGGIIITTNLDFESWEKIFIDPVLTGALADRIARKAHILDISRENGGRFEETIAWLKNKK